jgi:hypothetical protein
MFKMGSHDPFEYLKHKSKKGRESKCQFDFQPFKVRNRLEIRLCRWHATYCWKVLDESYTFF